MNQILSTEDPNKKNKTKKTNSADFNKIIKVFCIAIFIFGAILIGIYAYKLLNKKKTSKIAKPEITLEEFDDNAKIVAKAEAGINKVIYYWDINEQTEKSFNGTTATFEEAVEIPNGENTLTVKVIDQNGQVSETNKGYTRIKDIEKPVIEIDKDKGTQITITDETELAYATYKWEDEPDENITKVEAEPKEGETVAKEIVIDITAKKGTNTLVITAVDAAGNTETLKKIYKGVSDPEIEVYREGEYLYMNIKHDLGFKKVEFSVNGQVMVYDENYRNYDATKKELSYKFQLKEGKNQLIINATSNEDTTKTYNGECQYP